MSDYKYSDELMSWLDKQVEKDGKVLDKTIHPLKKADADYFCASALLVIAQQNKAILHLLGQINDVLLKKGGI